MKWEFEIGEPEDKEKNGEIDEVEYDLDDLDLIDHGVISVFQKVVFERIIINQIEQGYQT